MRRVIYPISIVIIAILFFSCEPYDYGLDKPSENILTETLVEVATQSIAISGGTVSVNASGSEINGMTISIPPNSYTRAKSFVISAAKITKHSFGEHFNPISPLIHIENGGGYADEIMEITIPIDLPQGHFAMGFFYDETTGNLEGIPVIELNQNSITLATRHFMSRDELRKGEVDLKNLPIDFSAASKILITSISEEALKDIKTITSKFKPGTDDFEFPNYGSYLSPKGHCAGQSISMMYYYTELKTKGADPLHGTYQKLDNIWQDNPNGYRLASVVQQDLKWDGKLQETLLRIRKSPDEHYLSWNSFAYSMLLTSSPQYVGLSRSGGGGHAIVAHRISLEKNTLYVTDPNWPGEEHEILFTNGSFAPYRSSQNSNDQVGRLYESVGYTAVSALIDWDKVAKRFKEFESLTIGNNTPNAFPDYTIMVKGDQDQVLNDNFTINADTLRLVAICPSAEMAFIVDNTNLINMSVFTDDGKLSNVHEGKGQNYVLLQKGLNTLGFYIFGWRSGIVDANDKLYEQFIDFKWFNIYNSTLSIDPNPIMGEPNENVTITARPMGSAPKNAKYEWNFGDDSKLVTVNNDSVVKHKFDKEGEYTVEVKLYDRSSNQLMAFASAQAVIGQGILGELQKFKWIRLEMVTTNTVEHYRPDNTYNETGAFTRSYTNYYNDIPENQLIPIQWNGASFSVQYDYQSSKTIKGTIQGEFTTDGMMLKNLSAEYEIKKNTYSIQTAKDAIQNIPLTDKISTIFNYDVSGLPVKENLVSSEFTDIEYNNDGEVRYRRTVLEIAYDATSLIRVSFYSD